MGLGIAGAAEPVALDAVVHHPGAEPVVALPGRDGHGAGGDDRRVVIQRWWALWLFATLCGL